MSTEILRTAWELRGKDAMRGRSRRSTPTSTTSTRSSRGSTWRSSRSPSSCPTFKTAELTIEARTETSSRPWNATASLIVEEDFIDESAVAALGQPDETGRPLAHRFCGLPVAPRAQARRIRPEHE
jgi:hypothetical protein